jgi:hypothetical protein
MKVDTYDGPLVDPDNQSSRRGIILTVRIGHGGNIYEKVKVQGSQTSFEHGWIQVLP